MRLFILSGILLLPASAAEAFPKPAPEKAFAELKVYDGAGSPLRVPREDWAGAQQRVRDAEWSAWFGSFRGATDDWMAQRKDRVEWVAGWWHDFVSPKDGSFLTWTPEEPGEATLSSPSDPRVPLTPKLQRAWVFGFRGRHSVKIEDAAALWRITGEKRYAEWAASQLDFYAEHYLEWPLQTEKNPARLMHQSLDEAVNLIRYVRAARWLDGYVTPERRAVWVSKLFRPEAELLGQSLQRIHNIACWQRSAQAMVALYARDEALWRLAVDGEFGIRAQVARGITSDYLWLEQSLLYNNYVVSALLPFFTEAALAGRMETLQAEMASAENLMLAPVYLRFPDGKLPTPADSTGGFARAPNRGAFAAAYRLFPTRIGLEAAGKERSLSTLLDPPGEAGVVTLPEVTSRHWESSRMMVLRRGQWQVYFHYGQVDASHAQAEALNYEVYYGGLDVTHDPGTVGYGSPLHRGYYTTGWAHNTVLVDGQGQAKWDPGKPLAWEPEAGRMAAAQPSYRPGVSVERELRVDGKSLLDSVTVRCAGDQSRTIALAYHLQGRIDSLHALAVEDNPPPYWEKARTANFHDTAEFRVWIGKQRFRLKIQVAGEFRVIHATTPDAPPGKRESLLVETKGKEARFGIELTDDAVPGGVI